MIFQREQEGDSLWLLHKLGGMWDAGKGKMDGKKLEILFLEIFKVWRSD